MMGYRFRWKCICGQWIEPEDDHCCYCSELRFYTMDQRQARAVARELNRLEQERDEAESWAFVLNGESKDLAKKLADEQKEAKTLSEMLTWALQPEAEPRQKQPCGHERRFIVSEIDGCIVCEAQHLNALAERLMRENAELRMREEATDETD